MESALGSVRARLAAWLAGRVAWMAGETQDLLGQRGRSLPIVTVLGREHYTERRQSYPVQGRRDLAKVLRGELSGEPPTICLVGPLRDERREVSFFRLVPDIIPQLPRSLALVPESVLLARDLPAGDWAEIDRQGFRYYVLPGGGSQPAGGVLSRPELIALAAGIAPDRPPLRWSDETELRTRLARRLLGMPASAWWACRNPVAGPLAMPRLAWRHLGIAAAMLLLGYMALVSVYLNSTLAHRERTLAALAPEVQAGLATESAAREAQARLVALSDLWSERVETHEAWAAVASALAQGARLDQVTLTGRRLSLRGDAADASAVLATLAALPRIENVAFDAPVRAGRDGRQNFVVSLIMAGQQQPAGQD
jgi:hypothetical protein